MVSQRMEREREESRRRMADKDKLLSKRALQINALQGKNNRAAKTRSLYIKCSILKVILSAVVLSLTDKQEVMCFHLQCH